MSAAPVEVRLPLMRELWAEDRDSLSSATAVRAGCMAFLCENFCAFSWRNFNGLIYQNVRARGNWNIVGAGAGQRGKRLHWSWRFMAYARDAIQARLNGRWSFPEMAKHGKLKIYIFFWLFAFWNACDILISLPTSSGKSFINFLQVFAAQKSWIFYCIFPGASNTHIHTFSHAHAFPHTHTQWHGKRAKEKSMMRVSQLLLSI